MTSRLSIALIALCVFSERTPSWAIVPDTVLFEARAAVDGPGLCSCTTVDGQPGHTDPVCLHSFSTCSDAKFCQCLPNNISQLQEIAAVVPANGNDELNHIAALYAQVSRGTKTALLVVRGDTPKLPLLHKAFFQIQPGSAAQGVLFNQIRAVLFQNYSVSLFTEFFVSNIPPTNGIDDTLRLSKDGRIVHVTGPLLCPAGQHVRELWVDVTQEGTGAFARVKWEGDCTGTVRTWKVDAKASMGANTPFVPGPATVCAAAVFEADNVPQNSVQWCGEPLLLEE